MYSTNRTKEQSFNVCDVSVQQLWDGGSVDVRCGMSLFDRIGLVISRAGLSSPRVSFSPVKAAGA